MERGAILTTGERKPNHASDCCGIVGNCFLVPRNLCSALLDKKGQQGKEGTEKARTAPQRSKYAKDLRLTLATPPAGAKRRPSVWHTAGFLFFQNYPDLFPILIIITLCTKSDGRPKVYIRFFIKYLDNICFFNFKKFQKRRNLRYFQKLNKFWG